MIQTAALELRTQGNAQIIDITDALSNLLRESNLRNGIVTVFTPSATSAITTMEYESGAVEDLRRLFDEIAGAERDYHHNLRWHDGNGHSHVRAALLGPSITVPYVEGALTLGTWQRIVFIDFDNRPRSRRLVVQMIGE